MLFGRTYYDFRNTDAVRRNLALEYTVHHNYSDRLSKNRTLPANAGVQLNEFYDFQQLKYTGNPYRIPENVNDGFSSQLKGSRVR